jgi:hypothetical protein
MTTNQQNLLLWIVVAVSVVFIAWSCSRGTVLIG